VGRALSRLGAAGALVALAALVVARFVHLGADPPLFKALDNSADEGIWLLNARSLALTGVLYPDDVASGPTTAPLFHWLAYVSFRALGVSLSAGRLVSALAFVVMAVAFYVLLRACHGRAASLTGVALLAGSDVLFAGSRHAVPEMLQLSWLVVSGALLVSRDRGWAAAAAGLAFGCAGLAKLSAFYLLPIPLLWWAWCGWARRDARRAARGAALFAVGVALPVAAFAVWPGIDLPRLLLTHETMNRRVMVSSAVQALRAPLTFVSHAFWGTPSVALLLGVVVADGAVALARSRIDVRRLPPTVALALAWLAGGVSVVGFLVRLPLDHRLMVFLVPLAILAASQLEARAALGDDRRVPTVRETTVAVGLAMAWAVVMLFVTLVWARHPRPAVSATAALTVAGAALALAALGAGAAWRVLRQVPVRAEALRRGAVAVAAVATLLPALRRCAVTLARDVVPFASVLAWVAVATLAFVVGWWMRPGGRPPIRQTMFLGLYAIAALGPIAVALIAPTSTLRAASGIVDGLAPSGTVISGALAETLAVDTRLRPLLLNPLHPDKHLLNAGRGGEVGLFVVLDEHGVRAEEWPAPPERFTLVRRLELFPRPLAGGPRFRLTVYRRL
jgi:hypothetical protein